MAVKFFRISDRGSLKQPTLPALLSFSAFNFVTLVLLRDMPLVWIGVSVPFSYVFFGLLLSAPFRIPLARFLHESRYRTILASPKPVDKLWMDANEPIFARTGIKVYRGEPMTPKSKIEQ